MKAPSHGTPRRSRSHTALLRRQQQRLARAFAAALVALSPAALLQACGDGETQHVPREDAGTGEDAMSMPDHDAGGDAATDADASDALASCTPTVTQTDAGIDGDPGCRYDLPCGLAPELTVVGCDIYVGPDGSLPLNCTVIPGHGCEADAYAPGPNGAVVIDCKDCLGGGGRRPTGLARGARVCGRTALGAYFARMAYEEASSVHAFRRLREELILHGAPRALVRAAERSVREEEHHARVMARYARAHGAAAIPEPRLRDARPRSLEAVARENAVEGCVRETFGALLLRWQAARAPDPSLRRALARIAGDEARHAALSWAIAQWAEGRLDRGARARVQTARARAVAALRRETRTHELDAQVGRPGPADRAKLVDGLMGALALS
jgi:hypothetical protein